MLVVTDDQRLALTFGYLTDETQRRVTEARLYKVVEDTRGQRQTIPVALASSACSPQDPFVKETGRQLAVRRLAEMMGRDIGGQILAAYFSRRRGRHAGAI